MKLIIIFYDKKIHRNKIDITITTNKFNNNLDLHITNFLSISKYQSCLI